MKSAAILIVLTLMPAVLAQTKEQSSHDSRFRDLIADCQRSGWSVQVTLKSGEKLIGKPRNVAQDTFQIAAGKEVKTIAYSDVRSAGSYFATSNSAWSRLGRGVEASVGYATIGTFVALSYPTTKLAEHNATKRADAIDKQIKTTLPLGSSKSDIIAFLNSKKIGDAKVTFRDSRSISDNPNNGNFITAVIRCRNGFSIEAFYIQMTFYLDGSDRLTDYKVQVISDSL